MKTDILYVSSTVKASELYDLITELDKHGMHPHAQFFDQEHNMWSDFYVGWKNLPGTKFRLLFKRG